MFLQHKHLSVATADTPKCVCCVCVGSDSQVSVWIVSSKDVWYCLQSQIFVHSAIYSNISENYILRKSSSSEIFITKYHPSKCKVFYVAEFLLTLQTTGKKKNIIHKDCLLQFGKSKIQVWSLKNMFISLTDSFSAQQQQGQSTPSSPVVMADKLNLFLCLNCWQKPEAFT